MSEENTIEIVNPVTKCCSSLCQATAAFVVYWPGQTKNMCAKCCGRAAQVAAAMGFDLPCAQIPPRTIVAPRIGSPQIVSDSEMERP